MSGDLERRGYTLHATTRAMGMALDDIRLPRPNLDLGPADWSDYLKAEGLPPGFLRGADHAAFHVLVARIDGAIAAAALATTAAATAGSTPATGSDQPGRQQHLLPVTREVDGVFILGRADR